MNAGNDPDFDANATRQGRAGALQTGRTPAAPLARPVGQWKAPAATDSSDIGHAAGDNLRELVVSCDAAPALWQQFDHARPEFIAVHGIGTASPRKLLAGVAEATGLRLQQLVIRRQGYGNTLATLEFLEFTGDGGALRVYSTDAEADAQARLGLARVLLACSRLGVLMVGDLPAQAIASALKPLRDDIVGGPWSNRELLLLPLASSAALAAHGSDLGRGTGVTVRTTPAALRPSDAWTFISGAWSRLRTQLAATGKLVPSLVVPSAGPAAPGGKAATPGAGPGHGPGGAPAPLEPRQSRPMTAASTTSAQRLDEASAAASMARYVEQLGKLNGMLDCCVFEAASGRCIARATGTHEVSALASAGALLLAAIGRAGHRLGLGAAGPEVAITLETRHLVLRGVPRHPHLMLHAILDKDQANLTLARLQIQRLDELFDER